MGWGCPPYYGKKKSNFYAKKIAKAEKCIAKQNAIIAECKKQIDHEAKTEN